MPSTAPRPFGAQLKSLREAAGFTQEELAAIAGLSVHAVSALERGERRRPQFDTVRSLSAALDLPGATRDALLASARLPTQTTAVEEAGGFALPLPLTAFVGREADMQILRQWTSDPTARLITLVGPGGVGKTRLALELARSLATASAIRVVFAPLAAIRNPIFVASAIAEAFGLSDVTAVDLPKCVRVACDDRPTLLVLDNFEQVLDATPLVADLLTSIAPLRCLATSRAPLRLRGEREYAVGPLALEADTDAADALARSPAVQLFVDRVRDVQPDFRLTPANGPLIAAICRRVDALPLALELTAPWMKLLTAEDLLRRLEDNVLLSPAGTRDLPRRQQTMNAAVGWSYQLLTADERRAFRRFAVLPGLFPIDAAAAVLAGHDHESAEDDALRAALSLIDKSLLVRAESAVVPTCPLYYMLETVRAYATLELNDAGERDDSMEGLVRYCIAEASQAAEGLRGPAQVEWLDRVREDLESYRAALGWLVERRRSAEAADIAWWLKYFWLIRGHAAEGLQWYEQILSLPSLPTTAEARALLGAAGMWWTQGELARARAGVNRALTLASEAGDLETVAQAEHVSGHVEHSLGNVGLARERFARSIEGFRMLTIPSGIGNALSGMAVLSLATGDVGEAEHLLDEATSVLRHAGPWFLTWALYVSAVLTVRRGNPNGAILLVRESLTRIRELHDKFAFVYALVPLAAAAVFKGDDAWAARILGARDTVTESTGVTVVDRSVQDLRDQAEQARARLGPDRWAVAYAAGRRGSIDSILADIDRALG
jgi:predicted ATPase/DNA-binding XRE family transcriptional regulator